MADAYKDGGPPVIPGYQIEGVLGRGATGVVYRARQLSVERVVALKVLHRELAGTSHAARRLQREARTTARLAHPNIISAIDMGEVDGLWWYAMELVDGSSLQERLRERALTEREALRLVIPLVDALQHAFERGVVHRDIKPANILVARDGRALLVDLGLAFAEDDPLLTKAGGTLGTPHYISPEQARDPAGADAQSDLWSLGATMYHAVCGRPPFSGESVAEILAGVLYAKIPDPLRFAPNLSRGFVLVLRKCLTRDKTARYATPAELLVDLERVRERRAPLVSRRSLEPIEHDRAHLTRVVRSVAAALVLVAGIAWAMLALRDGPALSADSDRTAPVADPAGEIARAAEGDSKRLTGALIELEAWQSRGPLSADETQRLESLQARLYQRLENELWRFKRDVEARHSNLIAGREYDPAEALATRGVHSELAARVGSQRLPARMTQDLDRFSATLAERARSAKTQAQTSFGAAVDQHWKTRVLPRVDELQARGAWRSARALLTVESADWLVAAQIPSSGLASESVERTLATLRVELDRRREALDESWAAVDASLREWVIGRVVALATELDGRELADADGELALQWETELAERKLSVDEMPLGLLHLAHEELARGMKSLVELERRLAQDDAQRGLAELEEETRALWRERRYSDIARLYEARSADAWREPVRPAMELRAREARLLAGLFDRAATGARARDGRDVALRAGTIAFEGKLSAGSDPLAKGLRLTLSGGVVRTLALVPATLTDTPGSALLSPEAIEFLAGLPTDNGASTAPEDRLLRALFRLRDGEPAEEAAAAAQAVLNSGPLPRGEPLVADLENRVTSSLRAISSAEGERAASARGRLSLLRRENASAATRESVRLRAEELIQHYADVLTPSELSELRRIRDELFANQKASTREEFELVFGPSAIEFVAPNRARLRFDFGAPRSGRFEPGAWLPEKGGWAATRYAKSDEDMLAQSAPTLVLREPLRVQSDVVNVRVRIAQPEDSPPDLFVLSCAGFHVLLTGAREGRAARCLIESGELADAIARARAGIGKEFSGRVAGATHELALTLNRGRGTLFVDFDGKRIAAGQRLTPRGETASLSVRSFEPVRLLSVTIEALRR